VGTAVQRFDLPATWLADLAYLLTDTALSRANPLPQGTFVAWKKRHSISELNLMHPGHAIVLNIPTTTAQRRLAQANNASGL
jgi:hypothetical protein